MSEQPSPDVAIIVGGGLTGLVLAMYLTRRGMSVRVLERSPETIDGVATPPDDTSSINLTLSARGLAALDRIGVGEAVRALTVPLSGRLLHLVDGTTHYQPYGSAGDALLAIKRRDLSTVLTDEAARMYGVRPLFGARVADVDAASGAIEIDGGRHGISATTITIGADGAFSTMRASLVRRGAIRATTTLAALAYNQLDIPVLSGWTTRRDVLHLWPRGGEMMLAIPNRDDTFTAAALLPLDGRDSHYSLLAPKHVEAHFRSRYPDAIDHVPALARQFLGRRQVPLVTVRCRPWSHGRVLLIGDAAHAVFPSYGQGANAGFEDCSVLDDCLDDADGVWATAIERFESTRRPSMDAMADLSSQHLEDLRSSMASSRYRLRTDVESELARRFPGHYRPLYETIAFTSMPYDQAVARDRRWRPVVDELCRIATSAGVRPLPDPVMHDVVAASGLLDGIAS